MSANRILKFLPPPRRDDLDGLADLMTATVERLGHALNHLSPEMIAGLSDPALFAEPAEPLKVLIRVSRAAALHQLLMTELEDIEMEMGKAGRDLLAPGESYEWLDWRVTRVGDRLVADPIPTGPKSMADVAELLSVHLTARARELAASGHLPENGAAPVDPPPPG